MDWPARGRAQVCGPTGSSGAESDNALYVPFQAQAELQNPLSSAK